LRSKLWDDPRVDFWYKQNVFVARRDGRAGSEPRLKAIIHPVTQALLAKEAPTFEEHVAQIEDGRMPFFWYLTTPPLALFRKLTRKRY
jgi:hypothetical protein